LSGSEVCEEDVVRRLREGFPCSGEGLDEVDGRVDLWWRVFEVGFDQEVVLFVGHLYSGFKSALTKT